MNRPTMPGLRIIKLGGSLLSRPTWREDLQTWVRENPSARTLILVGGGKMVDAVRAYDAESPLPSRLVHWACVDLLHTSWLLASAWVPHWKCIETEFALNRFISSNAASPTVGWVSPRAFYSNQKDPAPGLPEDWRTTTDSVSAFLASLTAATELVIFKSCSIPAEHADRTQWLAALKSDGIVDEAFLDPCFPQAGFELDRIRILRLPGGNVE